MGVAAIAVTMAVGGGVATGTAAELPTGSAGGQGVIGTGSLTDGTGSDGIPLNGTWPVTGSIGTGSAAGTGSGNWLAPVIDSVVPAPDLGSPDLETLRLAMLPKPVGEAFFDEYPPGLAGMANGAVIGTRDVTPVARTMLRGPVREVRQFKVKSTDSAGAPSFATATLVVPATPWPGPGPRPVLVNNVPINSLGRACAPGYTLANGITPTTSKFELMRPVTAKAEERGYAVLVPDHEGPRMAYGEPFVGGHAILDSLRGMRTLYSSELGDSPIAMMGYSGGAIATHGAVKLIDSYAPELAGRIVGASMGGVPADFEMLSRTMNGNLAGGLFLAALFGVSRENPEILTLANKLARQLGVSSMKDACGDDLVIAGIFQLPAEALANVKKALVTPVAHDIYTKTKMADRKSGAPLYFYNGGQDFWVPALGTHNLYREQCGYGVAAVYRQVPGEHFAAELSGVGGAFDWVDARLRGEPAPNEC
ncbi:lipase family protein [Rhodococcus kronopolitis]|uniref:Lipase family protein n=1 Tax=Rhodococcus kronopolitis TaxID=1460226 RepID=A0ABV9FPR5_9NOCA